MQLTRPATLVVATTAALCLTATVAAAAPAANAPSIKNSTQALRVKTKDGPGNKTKVVFTGTTWRLPKFADHGTFTNSNGTVVLKTTSNTDKGCTYTGTYVKADKLYEGKVRCPGGGHHGNFTLTTTGF